MGKAIILKTPDEIKLMQEANQIVAETLTLLSSNIAPGITTWELDALAESFIRKKHAKPAFKGYRGFPGSVCISINEQVVHGIPSRKVVLRDGDIVSLDFGVKYKGFYGDSAITLPIGSISPEKERLVQVTKESLYKAIDKVKAGNRINDISKAVQQHVEKAGFSVVRQFVGHGIGHDLHEPPEIPNYSCDVRSPRMLPGMVLAIEPMVNAGNYEVRVLKDGWTVVTTDRSPSAHFEHSVAVTEEEPLILSELKIS